MEEVAINYKPPWYLSGNADETWMALAYGILALGTIFLIKHIFSSILSSGKKGILLSDAAANITFRNSSWIEIIRWTVSLFNTRDAERMFCKRAILAVFLRFFIFPCTQKKNNII